jgi:DNA polymerase-1
MTQACLFDLTPLDVIAPHVPGPRPADWVPDTLPDLSRVRGPVAFDMETTGLRWWAGDKPIGLSISWHEDSHVRSRYVSWAAKDGSGVSEDAAVRWLVSDQGLRGKVVLGLNTQFDAHHFEVLTGRALADVALELGDVGHEVALLDDHRGWARTVDGVVTGGFSLEGIAQDYLGAGKVQGLDMKRGAHVYAEWEIAPYGRQDASLVLRLADRFRPLLEAQHLGPVLQLERDVLPVVVEMERNAALIDVEKLRAWDVESVAREAAAHQALRRLTGRAVNPDVRADVLAVLERAGVKVWEDRAAEIPLTGFRDEKTGRLSFSDECLAAAGHPVAEAIREAGAAKDFRSKFVVPYSASVQADGLLRFSLHQLRNDGGGTVSGRFSCSKATRDEGANIQQVSPEVKELYVAPEGRLLFSADAKQIEYRVFADIAARTKVSDRMLGVYLEDPEVDFHDDITGPIARAARPDVSFTRREIKTLNFMNLFGGGVDKHARMLGVTVEEARKIVEAYRQAIPEAQGTLRKAATTAESRGYVRTVLGRRARFKACPRHGWTGPSKDEQGRRESCGACPRLHKALNAVVQGTAADVNKEKLVDLYRERKALGLTMRMTIHDEVVGDVPDQEAARRCDDILNRQPERTQLRVQILWDSKVGRNWKDKVAL